MEEVNDENETIGDGLVGRRHPVWFTGQVVFTSQVILTEINILKYRAVRMSNTNMNLKAGVGKLF